MPLVLSAYVLGYGVLVALGASGSLGLGEVVANGILVASVVAVGFGFFAQLDKFISKIVGA